MASLVTVDNLSKRFWRQTQRPGIWGALRGLATRECAPVDALSGVSFTIEAGELIGYIGPNGAGKSTTVKILSGILTPTGGSCNVMGRVPWRERRAHVRHIGVVFGQRTQLWWDLPVCDSFDLLRDIYDVSASEYRRTRAVLDDLLDLGELLHVPVRQLSLGQRMRCELAAALLHRPQMLFLDEPTIGLDAVVKPAVRRFILEMNRQYGVTVILTTHDMDDVEALCQRVMLIDHGRLMIDGPIDTLRQAVGAGRRLTLHLEHPAEPVTDPDACLVDQDGCRCTLQFDPETVPPTVLISRLSARYRIRDLYVENLPIEEAVARLYRGEWR